MQETLYVRYVSVITFDSLNSKGLPVNFSWTDQQTKEEHKNTNKLDVLKGQSINYAIWASLINGSVNNLVELAAATKGTYTAPNLWYKDPAGTNAFTVLGEDIPTSSKTLYGYYYTTLTIQALNNAGTPLKYSFTDNYLNQTINTTSTLRIKKGETINAAIVRLKLSNGAQTLADISVKIAGNYTFRKWYNNVNGTNEFTELGSYIPTADKTIYGKWVSVITPIYNGMGGNDGKGNGIVGSGQLTYDVVRGQSTNLPWSGWTAELGYGFNDWWKDPNFTQNVGREGSTFTPTGNMTIYGQWFSTITFNNNGLGTVPNQINVIKGRTIGNLPELTDTSGKRWKFAGWYNPQYNSAARTNATPVINNSWIPTGHNTLIAKWTMTVDEYNNKDEKYTETFVYDQENVGLYRWSGYLTEGMEGKNVKFEINPNNKYEPKRSITANLDKAIPEWPNRYTVKINNVKDFYSAEDATGYTYIFMSYILDSRIEFISDGTVYDTIYKEGQTLPRLPSVPNLDGYTFRGWWTEPDGGGVQVEDISNYKFDYYTKLYAKWVSVITYMNPYIDYPNVIKYDQDSQIEVVKGQSTILPEMETLYTFAYGNDAFYTEALPIGSNVLQTHAGTKVGNFGEAYVPTGNITLYGQNS